MRVHSRRKSKQKIILRTFAFFLCVLLIGLLLPAAYTVVSRIVLYPVYATQNWLRDSTSSLPTYLRDKGELAATIEELERELATAKSTNNTQQRLYEENNRLRGMLSATSEGRIAAAVVARPNQLPYDYLQIDQGEVDGIQVGAPVYVGVDQVVGLVAHTDTNFALVRLFSTPDFQSTAFVSGPNIVVTLEGVGGGVARVLVPQGVPIAVGNLVHIPSIEPGVFGRIAFIENEPTQPEQYGYITLESPISSTHYVAVGREPLVIPDESMVREQIDEIIAQNLKIEGLNTMLISTSTDEILMDEEEGQVDEVTEETDEAI